MSLVAMSVSVEKNLWQSHHLMSSLVMLLKYLVKNPSFHKFIEKIMEKVKVFSVRCAWIWKK